jgi:HPt (histidine-containing phosphotransfer) domain-containing protein
MSAPLSAGASEAVDPETLAILRAMDGGDAPGFFDELVGLFLTDLAGRLAAIEDAVSRADAGAVRAASHSLRGSAANLGARPLAALCGRLEADGKSGALADAAAVAAAIAAEALRVRIRLEREILPAA